VDRTEQPVDYDLFIEDVQELLHAQTRQELPCWPPEGGEGPVS